MRIPFGALSRLMIIVDPVVVMPDMLSKKASTNDKLRLEIIKGKHPKMAMLNHENVVRRKACCKFNFLFSSKLVKTRSIPINVVIEEDERKVLFISSYIHCTKNGISMNNPSIIRSMPTAKKTVLLLFIFEVGDYLKIFKIQHNKIKLYLYFGYKI
jgi:hypothetical protein